MQTSTQLAIFMDNATAKVFKMSEGEITTNLIDAKFSHQMREQALSKSENLMHEKEQQHQAAYYHTLADLIKVYKHVLIFGPTNAKLELHNYLKKDKHFDDIKIDVMSSDKISDAQQEAFVRDYFKLKV
jgi:Lhr-like helicase